MKKNEYGVWVADQWRDYAPFATASDLCIMWSEAVASGFCIPENPSHFLQYLCQDGQIWDAVPDYGAAVANWIADLRVQARREQDGHILNMAARIQANAEGWRECPACGETSERVCPVCHSSGWICK